jgi:hypothetical protein
MQSVGRAGCACLLRLWVHFCMCWTKYPRKKTYFDAVISGR